MRCIQGSFMLFAFRAATTILALAFLLTIPDAGDAQQARKKKPRPIDQVKARSLDPAAARPKVIDGTPATVSEFPFQVALIRSDTEEGKEYEGQFCGATLLNELWVLTAAHCVQDTRANEIQVYVGATVLPRTPQEKPASAKRIKLADGPDASVVIPHENYNPDTYDNDIALLKLEDNAPRQLLVLTPAGSQAPASYNPGQTVIVIGWGRTQADDPDSASAKLLKGEIILQPSDLCQQNYTSFHAKKVQSDPSDIAAVITGNMFCAGVPTATRDSAKGDSGGFIGVSAEQGRFIQLGIVSYGEDATPGLFGVYTRVANYEQWMKGKMSAN